MKIQFRFIVLLVTVMFAAKGLAQDDALSSKVWQILESTEEKLNRGLPKTLAPNLWVNRVVVDSTQKMVRYEGVIKQFDKQKYSARELTLLQLKAKKNTTNFLCNKPASENFLRLLDKAGGQVEYVFYYEQNNLDFQEWFRFNVSYQECVNGNISDKTTI